MVMQVYDTTVSYYVDGTGLSFSARSTRQMVFPVVDDGGIVKIGQNKDGQYR